MNEYDEIIKKEYPNGANSYGIKHGGSTVVLVKTGRGGRVYAERGGDLYAALANEIRREFGYSAVVSDNPTDEKRDDPLDDDIRFVTEYFKHSADISILYVGYSSGANYGAWYGHKYSKIRNMLLVNPILNFNLHKTYDCCERFHGIIEFAMGEDDPSAKWAKAIDETQKIRIRYLHGQGHRVEYGVFINTVSEFIKSLPKSQ